MRREEGDKEMEGRKKKQRTGKGGKDKRERGQWRRMTTERGKNMIHSAHVKRLWQIMISKKRENLIQREKTKQRMKTIWSER